MSNTHLPQPSAEELLHSQQLIACIRAQIAQAGGSIPFMQFMQQALYAPGLGYYRAGLRKFGVHGDFVTAPEISPLFSRCLAQTCAEVFAALQAPPSVLEFGAGSGIMAADILAELEQLGSLPQHYNILEISAELQQRQRETLQTHVPHLLERVHWLSGLPANFCGIVLGNEVLDAMPVQRFRVGEQGIEEQHVAWDGEHLIALFKPADARLTQAVQALGELPSGYESEWNPQLPGWFRALSDALQQAVVLLIDYGFPRGEFYHPQRDTGTLMCHYRHHAHPDALYLPGLQDITAHVDFAAVADAAYDAGLQILGYTPQLYFLLHSGLQTYLETSDAREVAAHARLVQQIQPLILPAEMGELFKVIALGKDLEIVLRGFQQDFKNRL